MAKKHESRCNRIILRPSLEGEGVDMTYCLGRGKSILILENVPSLKAEGLARRLENVLGCDRDAMMFRRQATGAKKE